MTEAPVNSNSSAAQNAPSTESSPPTSAETQNSNASASPDSAVQESSARSAEASTEPRLYTVKVDGQEVRVTEAELMRGYGATQAAQRRMDEAARIRRQAEAILRFREQAAKDPKAAREYLLHPEIGLPRDIIRALGEELIYEELQQAQLSPEQRRIRELEAELERNRQAGELEKMRQAEEQYKAEVKKHLENYNRVVLEALQKISIPKNEYTVKRMGEYLYQNRKYQLGYTPDQIGELVREDYENEIRTTLEGMEGEALLKMLGEKIANKIRKADLARLKAKSASGNPPPPTRTTDTSKINLNSPQPEAPISTEEFRERIRRRSEE